MNKILAIISLTIMISSCVIMFVGVEFKVNGETPCVDGLNRINLEGIMCENKTEAWFGLHPGFSLLMVIPSIFGLFLFNYSFKFVKVSGEEK